MRNKVYLKFHFPISSVTFLLTLCFLFFLFINSCRKPEKNELRNPIFISAKKLYSQQKYELAAQRFEKYLNVNPESAKTHYELATLYRDYLNEPVSAIYHYKCYLKYNPKQSSDNILVRKWLENAERQYLIQLIRKYPDIETAKQENHMKSIASQNEKLKAYIIFLKRKEKKLVAIIRKQRKILVKHGLIKTQTKSSEKKIDLKQQVPSGASYKTIKKGEFYIVCEGDTLTKISKKCYGTPKYHKLIFEANRDKLRSPSQLKIGQKLRIPVITNP